MLMPLQAGDRVGLFEILSVLGVGGMGEVYRAYDTKLHRDVAIKILPPTFAADPDRLTRFEREAQVLASLNHPHIAQIYGIVDLTNPSAGTGYALVLECVGGEELAHRLQRGSLSLEDALPVARQIAEALETAHEHGIVHRDLKPANIKIADDGTAKVLDFGLARADSVGERARAVSPDSPTFTSPVEMTTHGVILGTAAYMAPEQARGKPVDRRADIWAFGCVLYEMLAGRPPFSGANLAETLAAITRDNPDWGQLPSGVPPAVRTLLERCLEKDPRERLRDIGEARIALSRLPGSATPTPALAPPTRWPTRLAWAMVGLISGALAMLAWNPLEPVGSSAAFSLRQLTELPGEETHPDISPDGRLVAYTAGPAGRRDIYLLRVGGGRAINLTPDSSADDSQGAFSYNGERIAFRSERDGGGIFVMGVTGESVRRVTRSGFDPRWSPDGSRLVYATEAVIDPYSRAGRSELWTADVTSGTTHRLWEGDAVQPSWSPHATRIAFWSNTGGQRDIWTIPASGGTPVAVVSDDASDWAPEWSPDGGTLYFVSDRGGAPNLWQVPIDETTGVPRRAPTAVTNGVRALGSARISGDGLRMVVGATDRAAELSLVAFDPVADRLAVRTTIRSSSLGWCNPSHDAVWLACTSRVGHEDIVLLRSDGTETRRLTDDAFKDRVPVWSPDDRTIAFMSARSGRWDLWAIGADGSALRQLTDLRDEVAWGIWSPDGKRMAMGAPFGRAPYGIWLIDPSRLSTPETAVRVPTNTQIDTDAWSSDGTLVAGTERTPAGDLVAVTIWNVHTREMVNRIELPLIRGSGYDVSFVPGTRDMLVSTTRGVMLVNAETGRSRLISPLTGELSGAGHTLLLERTALDADLWLIEFQK